MLNIAILSRWHPHANGYANAFSKREDCRVTVIWDEVPQRGAQWAAEMGVDFEPDYDKLLARPDVDAICCTAPTVMHKELFLKACAAGKHIFTEKVLCPTKRDALEVKAAVETSGVKFVISYPMRCDATMQYAKKLIADGTLGRINYLRIRNCHGGVSDGWLPDFFLEPGPTGGGAMMDLGAHPMYLCSWLLGKPESVVSCFNKLYDKPVDDNCVSVMEFENKVIAVSETSFVTSYSPFSVELCGTNGTYMVGGVNGGAVLRVKGVDGWNKAELPGGEIPSAMEQFVNAVLKGGKIWFDVDEAVKLSELMEGAYKSWNEGRRVYFSEL